MEDVPRVDPPPTWTDSVTVREDVALAAELTHRWETAPPTRGVSVTDLLAPRQAYWRATRGPVVPTAERAARIESGRRVHRALESLIAGHGAIEVRVRRDGLVGRLDALTDRPIEFKTTLFPPSASNVLDDRPEYVDQLAMYCALTERNDGRLISVASGGPEVGELRTIDLRFDDIAAVRQTMIGRAEELRQALSLRSPESLPRCPWFDRGCEYREGSFCDCAGTEAPAPSVVPRAAVGRFDRPDVDADLAPRLADAVRAAPSPSIGRFRELIYPRRAYFERVVPSEPESAALPRAPPISAPYERLVGAIESGPIGEVARLATRSDDPEEEVPAFRGWPYLARTSRAARVPAAEQMVELSPQYALELGFRCAATGTDTGRAIVLYERTADVRDRLRVFEFRFHPVTTFSRLWRTRKAALERALSERAPQGLPPCPGWMYEDCPYRDECGCALPAGRAQR